MSEYIKNIVDNSKGKHQVCQLCGCNNISDMYFKNSFLLRKCLTCELVFIDPIPNPYELNEYYRSKQKNGNYNFSKDIEKIVVDEGIYNYTSKLHFRKNVNKLQVLDIGCFTGQLLSIYKRNGWDTFGIEFQAEAARYGRENYGLNILDGTPNIIKSLGSKRFDLITACGVIEHLTNLQEFKQSIDYSLKPGGFLLVQTPNFGSIVSKIMGKYWPPLEPPEHVFYFNESNLNYFFNTISIRKISSKPHIKELKLGYVLDQFNHWGRDLAILTKLISKVTPNYIRDTKFPFYGGEILWLGQKIV